MNDNIHSTREVQLPPGVSYSELRRNNPILKNVSKREFLSRPQLQIQVLGERLDAGEQSNEQPTSTEFSAGVTQQAPQSQAQANQRQMAYGGTNDFYSENKPNDEGLVEFAGGGTHEQNSNGGIPQGYDNQGNLNTVEEGETKYAFDDGEYIFSNRISTDGKFQSTQQANQSSPMDSIKQYAMGGGLTSKDKGTGNKAYPSVNKSDFAGGNRSYPIPTKADAIDALRLAGLHGRDDVRSKVFSKYPELKHADGGFLDEEMDEYDNTLYDTPLDDDFANSEPIPSPMNRTLQRAQGGDLIIKRIFGGVNTFAEGGPINPPKANISQSEEQGTLDRIDDIVLNPLTSLGYLSRGENIPSNLRKGLASGAVKRNTLDNVLDFVNPAFYMDSASQGIDNLSRGDFAGAAGEAMNFVPAMKYTRGAGRLARQEKKLATFANKTGLMENIMQHTTGQGIIGNKKFKK